MQMNPIDVKALHDATKWWGHCDSGWNTAAVHELCGYILAPTEEKLQELIRTIRRASLPPSGGIYNPPAFDGIRQTEEGRAFIAAVETALPDAAK